MNHEESLLFTGGEDGLVMVWKVSDREGRVRASAEPPVFFEEVLVTRSDLEEKTAITEGLRTRVEELKMENEYQLRLKVPFLSAFLINTFFKTYLKICTLGYEL